MDVFIHKPFETLIPFVNLSIAVVEIVVVIALLPTILRFLKRSKDLYISYGLIVLFFGIYSAYLFSKSFAHINYDEVSSITLLGIVFVFFPYNMMALRKTIDESFEISKFHKIVITIVITLLFLQIPFNNIFLALVISFISLLFLVISFKETIYSLKLRRGILSLLFFAFLVVSIVVDIGFNLGGSLNSLFILVISLLLMPFVVYAMVEQYYVVHKKTSEIATYLNELSKSSKNLVGTLEEVSNTKVKLEKSLFSISHDVNKFINEIIPTSLKLSQAKNQIVTLKDLLLKVKEEYQKLPKIHDRMLELTNSIRNHISHVLDSFKEYDNSAQDIVSLFSQISNYIDSMIQDYKNLLESLDFQKKALVEISDYFEKLQKNISLVDYISVSAIVELKKVNDIGMISIYEEIKNNSKQIHDGLMKVKGVISQLISINDDLIYLGKDIFDKFYKSISSSDLIVNEVKKFIYLISSYKEDVSSLELDNNEHTISLIESIMGSESEFEFILSEIIKFTDSLYNLSDTITKVNDFIAPLKNSMDLAKVISRELDREIRDIIARINEISSKIIY